MLTVFLAVGPSASAAQDTSPPSAAPYEADPRTLARIQSALAREPELTIPLEGRRFFLEVVSRTRTWQQYMAGSHGMFTITPLVPPGDRPAGGALGGGAGIDMLSIVRGVRRALREHEARQIRQRIDRELRIIEERADGNP